MPQLPWRRRANRKRLSITALTLATAASLVTVCTAGGPAASAATTAASPLVQTVTYQGQTITLRLSPVTVRATSYQVLVQQPDGSMQPYAAAPSQAYLGSVDGNSAAIAEGIIDPDGDFVGQVDFDRGGTWFVKNSTVTSTRGLTQPTTYKWPSSTNTSLNATVTPGQAGSTSYAMVLGYDLDNGYFNAAPINGSLANAVAQMDLNTVSLMGLYETDIEVHPMIGRIIIRASAANDPYTGQDVNQRLTTVQSWWKTTSYTTGLDEISVQGVDGGGLTWVGTDGNPGYSSSGSTGTGNIIVERHEIGHSWSALDNHTNGPEGPTIQSGNSFDRWDGTEVRSMLSYRNANLSKFTNLGTFATPLPPYAALDLVDHQIATVPFSVNPIANDFDVNGDPLTLQSVSATSNLGGKLTSSGTTVTYTPPTVTAAQTVDWATYVVKDTVSGKTATGVMEFRVDPYVAPAAPSTWPAQTFPASTGYQFTNDQSGLVAAIPVGSTGRQYLIQRSGTDAGAQWTFTPKVAGVLIKNSGSQLCLGTESAGTANGTRIVHNTCNGAADQVFKVVADPAGDDAIFNPKSGKCLAVSGSSLAANAGIVLEPCTLAASERWQVGLTPMSTWPAATPPTTGNQELVNAGTGLHIGTAVGAGPSANFIQTAQAKETALTFIANSDGTWQVRQTSSGLCFNDRAAEHADVVTWYCNAPTAAGPTGDTFRFVTDPLGGVMIVGALANMCVGVNGDSTASGTKIEFETCNTNDQTQRWTITASPTS